MFPLAVLCFFYISSPAPMCSQDWPLDSIPRKTVPYNSGNGKLFREEGVWNYSTMLLREDLGLLILGAREAIFALDINDITNKKAMVGWRITEEKQKECKNKGKDPEIECQNYIRVLHHMDDGRMYVCGTNAFHPTCDYMTYADGRLTLEDAQEDGKGKCPFDPFQRHSSVMVDGDLYSATSMNFLGSEPVVMRSSGDQIRTEFKRSWLNEPNFIYMDHIPESENSEDGDDDKVYLFFSETAVEYDFYNKLEVSRVARVCKGDMGGERTLQRKWTSFQKARLDCPVLDTNLPYIVQDVFRWCDGDWKTCIFYAVFTPQSDSLDYSAVCAYRMSDIRQAFTKGKFKTPVTVETSFVKWVMYNGDLPSPRPGACIDESARALGITRSLDLPDKTLQFIRDQPLMDQAVQPLNNGPLLVKRGAAFTRIIVTSVTALDGGSHRVMFIGTETGSVLKSVNYDGEMFIIEEVQLFQPSEPVKVLRFSNSTGQLYAGSELGAVQMYLSVCGRYLSCLDCVLARDPYCGWDRSAAQCVSLSTSHHDASSKLIQSLKDGDASLCPASESVKPVNVSFVLGNNVKLLCPPSSNLAQVNWHVGGQPIARSTKHHVQRDSLMILNASAGDAGHYTCQSMEWSHGREYSRLLAVYQLKLSGRSRGTEDPSLPQAQREARTLAVLQAMVVLLSVMLAGLVAWNLYRGHCPLPGRCGGAEGDIGAGQTELPTVLEPLRASVEKPTVSTRNSNSNNHSSAAKLSSPEENSLTHTVNLSSQYALTYIDDESEI